MNQYTQRQNGLTVIELMIIIAVIAIVAVISIPGSTVVLENYRLKTASSHLSESLDLALGEAQRRNSTVRVCPSSNARFCRTDGDWNYGWLVYSDGNGDGTVQEIELIKAFSAPSSRVRIIATGAVEKVASVTMAGLVPANRSDKGVFHICHVGLNPRTKTLQVNPSGTFEISRTQSGSGICSRG